MSQSGFKQRWAARTSRRSLMESSFLAMKERILRNVKKPFYRYK